MNYTNIYNKIISNAQNKKRIKSDEYFESHHIVPRSMGGSNAKSNLVLLTPKEHFVCHHLLHKLFGGPMTNAFWLMCTGKSPTNRRLRPNARIFELVRVAYVASLKGKWTGLKNPNHNRDVTGSNNPMYGTSRTGSANPFFGKKHSDATKATISNSNKGRFAGQKNCNSRGQIHTPIGVFDSCAAAGIALSRDQSTIWKRCLNPNFPDYYLIDA